MLKCHIFYLFEETMDRVYSISNNVMILGDINCNITTNNSLSEKIQNLCSATHMTRLIKEPTRVTPNTSSLID